MLHSALKLLFGPAPFDAADAGELKGEEPRHDDWFTLKARAQELLKAAPAPAAQRLTVRSTLPGVTVALTRAGKRASPFGGAEPAGQSLAVQLPGGKLKRAGTLEFSVGEHTLKLPVPPGASYRAVYERIAAFVLQTNGGATLVSGFYDASSAASQRVEFELT